MSDEYLWQKTGEDPEIEKLENVLAVFRYREATPPVPIAAVVNEGIPRWRITWAFALSASFAAIFLVAVALWFQSAEPANVPEVVFVSGPETHEASLNPASESTTPAVQSGEVPAPRNHSRRGKINATTASASRRLRAKDSAPRDSIASLSEEERYAYRQLMLALSISSSKLKIVQDTINGAEESETPRSTNQR